VILACLYAGYVLGNRWWQNRTLEREAREREAEAHRSIVERYGDGALKILTLYANPPVLQSGQSGLLCYGVANAANVRFEPQIPDAGPSLSRCLEVRPTRSTTYKLIAIGRDGKSEEREVQLGVR
jgi:hypothetical protein